MARGGPSWQAEGGAGVGGNEVGHGLRHPLHLHLSHGRAFGFFGQLISGLLIICTDQLNLRKTAEGRGA